MREAIQERIGALLAGPESDGIVSVYLFGSMAGGTAHRESDVDLGVLVDWSIYPTSRDRFELRLKLITLLQSALEPTVDLVILNDVPPTLGRAIVTSGERLFCLNEAADHAWVRDVQLRAADLELFLRRMRRIKLEALAR
jgi:predicted nucleotidyltransferase